MVSFHLLPPKADNSHRTETGQVPDKAGQRPDKHRTNAGFLSPRCSRWRRLPQDRTWRDMGCAEIVTPGPSRNKYLRQNRSRSPFSCYNGHLENHSNHRRIRDCVPEIPERTLDASVTPARVFSGQFSVSDSGALFTRGAMQRSRLPRLEPHDLVTRFVLNGT
jgi:hypothetical protein